MLALNSTHPTKDSDIRRKCRSVLISELAGESPFLTFWSNSAPLTQRASANRGGHLGIAHPLFTKTGATGHAERVARELEELGVSPEGHP